MKLLFCRCSPQPTTSDSDGKLDSLENMKLEYYSLPWWLTAV